MVTRKGTNYGLYNFRTRKWVYENLSDLQIISTGTQNFGIYKQEGSYGVIESTQGQSVPQIYYDIINIGTETDPVFLTEKRLENQQFEVHYFNADLKLIHSRQLTEQEYERSFCF